jgi:hypothetical protein
VGESAWIQSGQQIDYNNWLAFCQYKKDSIANIAVAIEDNESKIVSIEISNIVIP